MKSRHLPAMETLHQRRLRRLFWVLALILVGIAGAAFAQDASDPPGRVALVSYRQGSVVFAPQGDNEWIDLPQNRPLTLGDRLWTDRGARAELQLGSATLHVDSESQLGVSDLDDQRAQLILQQGSVNLRVRELLQGENMEIDTPNLALRALQPGDYRVDVDPRTGETRVTVQSGMVAVFGEGGDSMDMGGGQQANFAGRNLAQVDTPPFAPDAFGLWAAERNRIEDESQAARHIPLGVVGATELDAYGTWSQDPSYGAVWYPTVTVANWAPYRYGHWDWIAPWGWTWVDDAPWGFAPFHYGRWTMIGTHWAWVPGRMVARPVYSPALVVFFGGGGTQFAFGSGPAVGWYPLAPGEAWWPVYHASHRYVSYANFNINLNAYPRNYQHHWWRDRPLGVTAVSEDAFRRGSPVYRAWHPVAPDAIDRARFNVVPVRPEPRFRSEIQHRAPLLHAQPASVQPASVVQPGGVQRFWGGAPAPRTFRGDAIHDAARAQQEQQRLQWGAERAAREQQQAAERTRQQQDVRFQREQLLRQQQEQAGRMQGQRQIVIHAQQQERLAQERAQREAWLQQRQQQQQREQQQQQQPQRIPPWAQAVHPAVAQPQPQVQQRVQQRVQPQAQPAPQQRGGWHREAEERGGAGANRWPRG